MNTKNFQAWLTELWTTDKEQGKSQLAAAGKYCCLGLGSCLVPKMPVAVESNLEVRFGANEVKSLAPLEFIEWLGLEMDESTRESDEFDIVLDIENHYHVKGSYAFDPVSASNLNDWGFTFPQIADLFNYFGVFEVQGIEHN
jgi:hypothetical protein